MTQRIERDDERNGLIKSWGRWIFSKIDVFQIMSSTNGQNEEIELRRLVKEYHRRCEEFDQKACTGHVKNGVILPSNWDEYCVIQNHARQVWDELYPAAAAIGLDQKQWMEAIFKD